MHFQTKSWGDHTHLFVFFLHGSQFYAACLKTVVSYILSIFLGVYGRRVNLVTVTYSLKWKLLPSLFISSMAMIFRLPSLPTFLSHVQLLSSSFMRLQPKSSVVLSLKYANHHSNVSLCTHTSLFLKYSSHADCGSYVTPSESLPWPLHSSEPSIS